MISNLLNELISKMDKSMPMVNKNANSPNHFKEMIHDASNKPNLPYPVPITLELFHTMTDFYTDEYIFWELMDAQAIPFDLVRTLDSLEIEDSMTDNEFCNSIAVADYTLFRNKITYLKNEECLYHFCDPIILNLYIRRLNKIYTLVNEKKSFDDHMNFKILLDFIMHFLWWNIEWDEVAKGNLKFKSELVKEYLSNIEDRNESLILHCIYYIGRSTALANTPLKRISWILYLSLVHFFGFVDDVYEDNIYSRHYFKDKKYLNKNNISELINDSKNIEIFQNLNEKEFELLKNKPSSLSSYNENYLMKMDPIYKFFIKIYSTLLPDMIVAMLRGVYRACQHAKNASENAGLDINSEWYLNIEILYNKGFFDTYKDQRFRMSKFTQSVSIEYLMEMVSKYETNNYFINSKNYASLTEQLQHFDLAEVNRHYLLVCTVCTMNFHYIISKFERTNVQIKDYCNYLIIEASGLFVYLKIFNLYNCLANQVIFDYIDYVFEKDITTSPKFIGDWTNSTYYLYAECIASSFEFLHFLCQYYPYRIEDYIVKYGMSKIFLDLLDIYFHTQDMDSGAIFKAYPLEARNCVRNPTIAYTFTKMAFLLLKYNKKFQRNRDTYRLITLTYIWFKNDDPFYLVYYDKNQLADNKLNNYIQDTEEYLVHLNLNNYFSSYFKEHLVDSSRVVLYKEEDLQKLENYYNWYA